MKRMKKITAMLLILLALIYAGARLCLAVNYSGYRQTYQKQHWEITLNNFITAVQNDVTALYTSIANLTSTIASLNNLVTNWIITEDYPVMETAAVAYVDGDTFTVAGDKTAKYTAAKKIEAFCAADGMKYSSVASSSYAGGLTTVNLNDAVLTVNLSWIRITVTRAGLWPHSPGYVVAEDYGSPGQAAFDAAVAAIGVSPRTLLLGPGTWSFNTDSSTPATLNLRLERGAVLTRAGGDHLTIGGGFEAPDGQCIADNSTNNDWIIFESVSLAKPVWWGLAAAEADNNHKYTRSAINALCGNTNISGGEILFPAGRLPFASAIIDGTHPGNNLTFSGAGAVHATVAGTSTPNAGTILEYSGTGTLFKIHTADGTSNEGNYHWQNLAIVCTADGSAIELNNTTRTMASPHPCFLKNCSFENVQILGNGGAFGVAGLGVYNAVFDGNCYVQRFQRGIWLIDGDGNTIAGTLGLNSQNLRLESKTANYCNENRVLAMCNELVQYGGEDLISIYDTANATYYGTRQVEVASGQSAFYLNGLNTYFDGPYIGSKTGEGCSATLGANAKNIRFNKITGQVQTWTIAAPAIYYPKTSYGGDYTIYLDSPSEQFASTVPQSPRIARLNWPIPDGGPNTVAGVSAPGAAANAAAAYMGHMGAHSNHLLVNPFTKGFMGGGTAGLAWEADAGASTGYAFSLAKFTVNQYLARQLTVGADVAATDSLVVTLRCRASDTVTGGSALLQVYNATTAQYLLNWALPGSSTSYQVNTVPVALSGGVSAGDVLQVRTAHTWTGAGGDLAMYIDYLASVPVAQQIHTRYLDFEYSTDPGNPPANHARLYFHLNGTSKGQAYLRFPSGDEVAISTATEP